MTKLCLFFLLLLLSFPVMAQEPDGLLLFVTRENDVRSIHVLNATTGEQHLVSDLEGHTTDVGWAPDGRIWAVDTVMERERRLRFFDAVSGEKSTFSEPLLFDSCWPSLEWLPTGEHFAYFTGTPSKPILNILNLEDETGYMIPDTQGLPGMPLWSPDGRYMAFDDQILAVADGSEVISGTGIIDLGRFSPDSRFFAYWGETAGIFDLQTGYDIQTGTEQRLDPGFPINFAAWTQNDTVVLLYADLQDNFGNLVPQSLLSYDLASGAVQTLLETTGWVSGITQSGDWLTIRSSLTPHEQYAPSTHIQMRNGKRVIEKELTIHAFNPFSNASFVAWSADGRWLSMNAEDGIYFFDSEKAHLERLPIPGTIANNPFWSADGRYLAFSTFEETNTGHLIGVWTPANDSIEMFPSVIDEIIGWQYNRVQNSLLYCGIG